MCKNHSGFPRILIFLVCNQIVFTVTEHYGILAEIGMCYYRLVQYANDSALKIMTII